MKRRIEFTKLVLLAVMLTYFLTVGVGAYLSFVDTTQYSTLAVLVGAPVTTAIGFYAWKAKAENVLKYKNDNKAISALKILEGATALPENEASESTYDELSDGKGDDEDE